MIRHVCRHRPSTCHIREVVGLCANTASKRSKPGHRTYATVTDLESLPKPGEKIHGFTLKNRKNVPELHLTALHLEHDRTGAEYLHVAREDKNNVFAINFKTNPVDDTGLPHILEHVTLCGSEKYPVRDPFFKMMPRSLANFMNAFTSSDYTSYPFATTNKQDFRNLSSVYLDATLHPLLKESDFLQEGWRLGPEDAKEPASKENVVFKGVVYNEMKGQMSDASYLFYIRFRDHMFPSLHNSGGDPEQMTKLTHQELVDFSKRHYHPSNARLFSYGDMSLQDQLKYVNDTLAGFEKIPSDSEIKVPRNLDDRPSVFEVEGPVDTMQGHERQTKTSISWLTCETSDIVETFSLSICASLLMSGYGSPLYQGLIESGIGLNFSPNTGYDSSARVGVFSIGVDGIKVEDVSTFKEAVQRLLREKSPEAFTLEKVEGYMHQLEIALKHKTAAFGMGLLDKTLPGWFNGTNPLDTLAWNEVVNAFSTRMKDDQYLYKLVERYFLNDKCLLFTMRASESYNSKLEAQEQDRRAKIISDLEKKSDSLEKAMEDLGRQELALLHVQESAQNRNLETLPSLHVADISRQKEKKPTRWSNIGDVRVLWRETDTNGITYLQAKHVFKDLPDELRLLMPLYTESLMRLGTKTKSVGDLEAELLLRTGGISISPFCRPDPWSLDKHSEGLLIDGYALDRNVSAMLDLMHTFLLEIDFRSPAAVAAIRELLESKIAGALDSVAESGHHFATMSASAALSRRGLVQDQLSGLSQIEATAQLLNAARNDSQTLQDVIEKLQLIQSISILSTNSLSLRIVCEPNTVNTNESRLHSFLAKLPQKQSTSLYPPTSDLLSGSSLSHRTFFHLPFQVSYTGTCLQTAPYNSPDKAPLTILSQLLTHNFLHPEVREKGGAYGANASASPLSSLFSMSSYRDPNPRNSLSTFSRAGLFARDREWSDRELEESKLSVFQGIDAPSAPSRDGAKEFLLEITEDMEQSMREGLLDVKKKDVQEVANKYLLDVPEERKAVCVLGEKKGWVEEDTGHWEVRRLRVGAH